MQAITTKYIGPSNTKGSRIKATCDAGSITIPYPHELSGEEAHAQAAMALCRKLQWTAAEGYKADWVCGRSSISGYTFVYVIESARYNPTKQV